MTICKTRSRREAIYNINLSIEKYSEVQFIVNQDLVVIWRVINRAKAQDLAAIHKGIFLMHKVGLYSARLWDPKSSNFKIHSLSNAKVKSISSRSESSILAAD